MSRATTSSASCGEIDDRLRGAASRVRLPARQAERRTVRPHRVALLEAQLRGDEAAIKNLIDATNEYDLWY
jgi:hypothetical protein